MDNMTLAASVSVYAGEKGNTSERQSPRPVTSVRTLFNYKPFSGQSEVDLPQSHCFSLLLNLPEQPKLNRTLGILPTLPWNRTSQFAVLLSKTAVIIEMYGKENLSCRR